MKKVCILFFLLSFYPDVNSQQGSLLLTHYSESRNIENQNWAICQDNDRVMFFANRKGVLIFDGVEWKTLKIPTIPYSMQKNPYDGKIYIGGDNKFGYIGKDPSGIYRFVSFPDDSITTGVITRIIFDGRNAWIYSERSVNRFDLVTKRLDLRLDSKRNYPFTGMFVTPENTFINILNKGLHRIESDTLFPIVTGYLTENTEVLFSLPHNQDLVLVGLGNSTLRLFDGIKFYDYNIKDEDYLHDNILSEGIMLGDTAYAFSTLEGGAVVIEKSGRKLLYAINNKSQLPDDEIFAIGSDNSGGLWLSHQYGLTRADLNLPVSNYSIFPGLTGNLTSALRYMNELFVSTSEGVFFLSEIRSYDEKEILVRTSQIIPAEVPEAVLEEGQSSRKNIFTRIFGRKADPETETKEILPEPKPVAKYTRKKISTLKSVDYIFRKVEGLNEKCRQLVATPRGILAATNKGLYLINDHKAEPLTPFRYINHISWKDIENSYYVAAMDGYFSLKYEDDRWIIRVPDPEFTNPVYSVSTEQNGTLWLGGDNVVYKRTVTETGTSEYQKYFLQSDFPERYTLDIQNDSVYLFNETGVYLFNNDSGNFDILRSEISDTTAEVDFYHPLSNCRLIYLDNRWIETGSSDNLNQTELALLKIFDDIVSVYAEEDNIWVIDGSNKLYALDRNKQANIDPQTNILIKSVSDRKGKLYSIEDVRFDRGNNVIRFSIVAPGYLKQNTTRYQYFIDKVMPEWSLWSTRTNYVETVTKPGDYILQVRARDIWGNTGEPVSVAFTIEAPFTRTPLFYILTGLLFLFIVVMIVYLKEKQLSNENRLLEEKVKERTSRIEAQKMEITASIEYAGRIQKTMLPGEDHFKEAFSDHFIIYKPKNIVSGDFYWIGENEKSIFFTVADCTGHGVPGAFMSTMGISTLHEIIANNRNLQANKILNLLRQKIVMALHQTGKTGEMADGMDIAFCILSKDRKTMQFAGAFNPLIIVQGGRFLELKGDKMPIGIHYGKETAFTNHTIDVNWGDTIFLFSDGFASQFGGSDGKKYKKAKFRDLLADISSMPMTEQCKILETELENWKGKYDQVDDITIVGLRI